MAKKLSVSKADLLGKDSNDAAVKIAISEAHIIAETKKYLEQVSFLTLISF